jgi:hypothetical protein
MTILFMRMDLSLTPISLANRLRLKLEQRISPMLRLGV